VPRRPAGGVAGASGESGLIGSVADWWDSLPVGGGTVLGALVAAVVVAGGTVVAAVNGGLDGGDCAAQPLRAVYRPSRLKVMQSCADVTGVVVAWRHEHDGDYHVSMRMDDPGWTNPVNTAKQHGYTVVEFVPLLPRPALKVGERLHMIGTRVLDVQHGGWVELHPVFAVEVVSDGTAARNRSRLAPPTEDGDGGRAAG
jgi:hypothetical protein